MDTPQSTKWETIKKKPLPPYNFYYWGPLLFKIKMLPADLKECANLCSKKSSLVNDRLAGGIKHEHYVSTHNFVQIINPYLSSFCDAYSKWYKQPQAKAMEMKKAWVNFMRPGEFNPPHFHTDCDFSSVLIIQVPEKLKEEHKKFIGSAGGPGTISFTYGELQYYSQTKKTFIPEPGDFFIFPATLTHFVTPFRSEGERISMSANFKLE